MHALVLFSGGLDSSTLLARAVAQHGQAEVCALAIAYGQKHDKELHAAQTVATHYGVELLHLDLASIFLHSNSSLLRHSSEDLPTGSYGDLQAEEGKLISSYVPFRNGLFLSSAASVALGKGCSVLYYGAHHDDIAGNAYPDCSEEFVGAMNHAIAEGTGGELHLEAPFVCWSKAQIVAEGLRLGVPYEKTWSCYEGGERACGHCATCLDRLRAFAENDASDPLPYANEKGVL